MVRVILRTTSECCQSQGNFWHPLQTLLGVPMHVRVWRHVKVSWPASFFSICPCFFVLAPECIYTECIYKYIIKILSDWFSVCVHVCDVLSVCGNVPICLMCLSACVCWHSLRRVSPLRIVSGSQHFILSGFDYFVHKRLSRKSFEVGVLKCDLSNSSWLQFRHSSVNFITCVVSDFWTLRNTQGLC